MNRYRKWIFVINNPTFQTKAMLSFLADSTVRQALDVRYVIFQEEVGAQGTRHVQGYIQMLKAIRLSAMCSKFGTWHFEQAKGDLEANQRYCSKSDTRFEGDSIFGEYGAPAKGAATVEFVDMIRGGSSVSEIAMEHTMQYIRHHSGVDKVVNMNQPKRTWPPNVYILYGPTGTGKSAYAYGKWSDDSFSVKWPETNTRWWWTGYEHEDTAVLDEFRHQITLTRMLRLLDRTPMQVSVHNNLTEMNSHRIVITTNIPPAEWYPKMKKKDLDALFRRFDDYCKVYKFSKLDPVGMVDEDDVEDEQDFDTFAERINMVRVYPKWSDRTVSEDDGYGHWMS